MDHDDRTVVDQEHRTVVDQENPIVADHDDRILVENSNDAGNDRANNDEELAGTHDERTVEPDEPAPSPSERKPEKTDRSKKKKVKKLSGHEAARRQAEQVIVRGRIRYHKTTGDRSSQVCDVRCFLDTGSQVNLVNWTTILKMGVNDQVMESSFNLRDFGGNSIASRGAIHLELIIGGLPKLYFFQICEGMDTDILLGDPFFKGTVVLDYINSELRMEGAEPVPFQPRPTSTTKIQQIKWSNTTSIPPRTVAFVEGVLPRNPTGSIGLISPDLTRGGSDVYVAEAIAEAQDNKVVMKILNISENPVVLKEGARAAKFSPVPEYDPHTGVKPEDRHEMLQEKPRIEKWTKEELFDRLSVDVASRKLDTHQTQELKDILWENRDCFTYDDYDLGSCNMYTATIRLREGAEPQWTPPIPCPYKLEAEMERNIDEMLQTGVIEELQERSEWNSPTFLVKKKTPPGKPQKYRLVADLRNVNKVSMPSNFPLAHLDHVLDKIGKDTIFSSFDLSRGYWQLPYDEESKQITAFLYKNTQYAFAKTVMGHRTSGPSFCHMMNRLLGSLPIEQVIQFVDDLLLSASNVKDHLDRLRRLLARLRSAGLKVSPDKSQLLRDAVDFVGVRVSGGGIEITKDRVEALLALREPRSKKEVKQCMGAMNYVRKWIPRYSEISKPIHACLRGRKDKKFVWSEECRKAYETLKDLIAKSTQLAIPDTSDPYNSYQVTIDGSIHGLGATLSQILDTADGKKERRIIAYYSKSLPEFKRPRGQTRIEFEALCAALQHWAIYLMNVERFVVLTDCLSLLHAEDTLFAKSDAATINKIQKLAEFNFVLRHISGVENEMCDFLSRFPNQPVTVEAQTQTENKNELEDESEDSREGVRNQNEQSKELMMTQERKDDRSRDVSEEIRMVTVSEAEPETATVHDESTAEQDRRSSSDAESETESSAHESRESSDMDDEDRATSLETVSDVTFLSSEDPEFGELICMVQSTQCPEGDFEMNSVSIGSAEEEFVGPTRSSDDTGIVQPEECPTDLRDYLNCDDFELEHELELPSSCKCEEALIPDEIPEERIIAAIHLGTDHPAGKSWKEWEIAQESDDLLKVVRSWVKKGSRDVIQANRVPQDLFSLWKQFSLLRIEDGVLQRRWKDLSTEDVLWLIVVPWKDREMLIKRAHETLTCHGGVQATLTGLRRLFYWPSMEEEVKLAVEACINCAANRQPRKTFQAEMSKFICHEFNDVLVIDHITPDTKRLTDRGHSAILSMTDCFSNYVVAVPTVGLTALESRRIVEQHWINRFGYPHQIVTDQHQSFKGAMFKEYFEVYAGIKVVPGQAYSARSTARAESSNKRIDDKLRKMLFEGHPRDWDDKLTDVTFVLNNAKNRRTGFSPFRLVHGIEANIPETIRLKERARHRDPQFPGIHGKVHQMAQARKTLLWKVRQNVNKDFAYAKKQHDKKINDPELSVGDEVMVRIPCPEHKFSPRFIGPVPVKEVISPYLYRLEIQGTDRVVAVHKLKLFRRKNRGNAQNMQTLPAPTATQDEDSSPTPNEQRDTEDEHLDHSDEHNTEDEHPDHDVEQSTEDEHPDHDVEQNTEEEQPNHSEEQNDEDESPNHDEDQSSEDEHPNHEEEPPTVDPPRQRPHGRWQLRPSVSGVNRFVSRLMCRV